MKKQLNCYALMRIGFYEDRFLNQTIQQLVDEFNQLTNSRGWAVERSYFSIALVNEMIRRGIDVSSVVKWNDEKGQILSVHYVPVRYDETSKRIAALN